MYVGKKYTATRTRVSEMEFYCPRCRFTSDVIVVGVGQGQGSSPYMLDNEGAAARAGAAAEKAAAANAELILRLAPCKRCGHRSGLVRFWVGNLLGAVAVALGCWLLAALITGRRSSYSAYIIFGCVAVVGLAVAGYMRWIHLSTAAGRVRFLEPEDAEESAPAPKRKKRKKRKARAEPEGGRRPRPG